MGAIGKAMLKAGLVSEEQLQKAEREVAEEIVNNWRQKYGSDFSSQLLFIVTLSQGGTEAIKEKLKN